MFTCPYHRVNERYKTYPSAEVCSRQYVGYQIKDYKLPAYTGKGIRVGICDTGISAHEDIDDVTAESFIYKDASTHDSIGHGTHVTGILSANNNDKGMMGVAPDTHVYMARVMGSMGGTDKSVAEGIDWCVQNKCHIINLSLNSPRHKTSIAQQIVAATNKGIIVVTSAGNTGFGNRAILFPGNMTQVITVGAVGKDKKAAPFSGSLSLYGGDINVIGPGVGIFSCYQNNTYARLSGTSMAVPWVCGILALLLEKDSDPELAKKGLYDSCIDKLPAFS
jgi:minor extracellular protease Epr